MSRGGGQPPTADRFRRRPKAELHLHLEGSIGPRLLHRLSGGRADAPVPSRLRSLYAFTGFHGFLRAFGRICALLRAPVHLEAAVRDLGRRLRRDNVVYAEVFFSPQVHLRNGMELGPLLAALEAGAARVEARGGPRLAFLADGVRQWGAGPFHRLVRGLLRHPSPRLLGVGLGGDEAAVPARAFARACDSARNGGLAVVVHAGEIGPAAGVTAALDWLRPRRIAHGIQAAADPALSRRLARERVPLDICLTSNTRTGAVPAGSPHPLPALVRRGVPVSLGTDDPALFRVSLSGEMARAIRLGLSREEMRRVALAGARWALLPQQDRDALTARLARGWR